ncbi:MAG TPA: hypothetical protein VFT98_03120, partial [Myxococcota bacterium]|nr:hypothetical protein [Myxococcota bacterium]
MRVARLLLALAWLGVISGCASPVGVDRFDPKKVRRELAASVLTGDTPSALSRQTLDREDLELRWEEDPAEALRELHARLDDPVERADRLFALAELSFQRAQSAKDPAWFRASAIYAYAFLFPSDATLRPRFFDPRTRLAMELYNQALTEGFREGEGDTVVFRGGSFALPFGSLEVDLDDARLSWGGYRVVELTASNQYRVRGLRNRYRRAGIGAALIGRHEKIPGTQDPSSARIAPRQRTPVTAFLRLDDPLGGIQRGAARG